MKVCDSHFNATRIKCYLMSDSGLIKAHTDLDWMHKCLFEEVL